MWVTVTTSSIVSSSATPATLTVCATFQVVAVNIRGKLPEAGSTVAASVSSLTGVTMTVAVGLVARAMV